MGLKRITCVVVALVAMAAAPASGEEGAMRHELASSWHTSVVRAGVGARNTTSATTGASSARARATHLLTNALPAASAVLQDGLTAAHQAASGIASFYWQGQQTASGEPFDKSAMTAAHRTLPFGTRVRVTHLANGKSVVVRINDRGPFKPGRIIDLSQSAAEAIGMTAHGLAKVKLEVLDDHAIKPSIGATCADCGNTTVASTPSGNPR